MKAVNAVILATGMYWIGLLTAPGTDGVREVLGAGIAGTAGLLTAFAATEIFAHYRKRRSPAP
mgnify:CR=1 FL=1